MDSVLKNSEDLLFEKAMKLATLRASITCALITIEIVLKNNPTMSGRTLLEDTRNSLKRDLEAAG